MFLVSQHRELMSRREEKLPLFLRGPAASLSVNLMKHSKGPAEQRMHMAAAMEVTVC